MIKIIRPILLPLISILVIAIAPQAIAGTNAFIEGTHYTRLKTPVKATNPGKIEVVLISSYHCSHCYQFSSLFRTWQQTKASNVSVIWMPVIWNKQMETHARIYYTAQQLAVLDHMHGAIFDAIHKGRKKLQNTAEIRTLFTNNGVDSNKFDKTFKSFGVSALIKKAQANMRSYGTTGAPELIVGGTYKVTARNAGSQQNMLKVVDYLIKTLSASK